MRCLYCDAAKPLLIKSSSMCGLLDAPFILSCFICCISFPCPPAGYTACYLQFGLTAARFEDPSRYVCVSGPVFVLVFFQRMPELINACVLIRLPSFIVTPAVQFFMSEGRDCIHQACIEMLPSARVCCDSVVTPQRTEGF